jgi:hypothetical protein
MKLKELERQELRERIMKQVCHQLYEDAENKFHKSKEYEEFKKLSWMKRTWILGLNDNFYQKIKKIQMELLEDEVNDALGEKNDE